MRETLKNYELKFEKEKDTPKDLGSRKYLRNMKYLRNVKQRFE